MMISRLVRGVVSLLVCGLAAPALAGPPEQLVELAVHPTDPDTFALRYRYGGDGLLVTRDGGETFALLCASAIDPALTRSGPLGIAADGTTFMGVFQGLFQDDGNSCGWNTEPLFDGQWVSDLAHDPADPAMLYLVTSSGNEGSENGVYGRDAAGAWAPLGRLEDVLISRLHVVSTDAGRRFYEGIIDGQVAVERGDARVEVANYVVRHSDDDAQTWTGFAFAPTEGTFRLQGVDPANPDRLVATLAISDDSTQVIVSHDRGESWTDWLRLSAFGGLAFGPDGQVWIGDAGSTFDPGAPRGIHHAASLSDEPRLLTAEFPVSCLRRVDGDHLFACLRQSGGLVDVADGNLRETFRFDRVRSFVACDGVDMLAACEAQLTRAYCTASHFADAPVCTPYGAVAEDALDPASDAVEPARPSGPPPLDDRSTVAMPLTDTQTDPRDDDNAMDGPDGPDGTAPIDVDEDANATREPGARSALCAVRAPGRGGGASAPWGLTMIAVLLLRRRFRS